MNVGTTLVADGEAAEAVEPSERALDDPAVPAQLLAAVDAASSDARLDVALASDPPAHRIVIGLVGMQLVGPAARATSGTADGRDRVQGRFEQEMVVAIGRAQETGERRPVSVDHNMALRARFAAIRWVRAGFESPFSAGTDALSSEARLQECPSGPHDRPAVGAHQVEHRSSHDHLFAGRGPAVLLDASCQ